MKPKTIALIIVAVLFVIILLQNIDRTHIELLFWDVESPLLILIVASIVIGYVIGWISHASYSRGKRSRKAEQTQ